MDINYKKIKELRNIFIEDNSDERYEKMNEVI